MKKYFNKKIISIVLVLTLFITIIIFNSSLLNTIGKIWLQNTTQLIIEPEYKEYYINEDFFILIKLENNSDKSYYLVNPLEKFGVIFLVTTPSG